MRKIRGGYIYSGMWEEGGTADHEYWCNMIIWGPLITNARIIKSKKYKAKESDGPVIFLLVDLGRNAPGHVQKLFCYAKGPNAAYARLLKRGDFIAAFGTWHSKKTLKDGEVKEYVTFTVESFINLSPLAPEATRVALKYEEPDEYEADIFEGEIET